jgi:hypothetical protein
MARRNRNPNNNYNNGRVDRYAQSENYRSNPNPPEKKSPLDVAKIAIIASL